MSCGNNNGSSISIDTALLYDYSIDTTVLDNTSIDSDGDGSNEKNLFDGGNNNGSDSGAFLGNSLINTTFLDNTSMLSPWFSPVTNLDLRTCELRLEP